MQERTNIWGKPNCDLPDGKLCQACCVLPNIELEGTYVSVGKPANSPCQYLNNYDSEDGQGCNLHPDRKPETCKNWHCSVARMDLKLDLIAQGLSLESVTESEAILSAKELFKGRVDGKVVDDIIKFGILDKSVVLTKITHKRNLIVQDLDET